MLELKEIKKVILVIEVALLDIITEQLDSLGIKIHSCVYCFGKDQHDNGISDISSNQSHVKIEILANEETANLIFNYLNKVKVDSYAVTAFIDSAFVNRDGG